MEQLLQNDEGKLFCIQLNYHKVYGSYWAMGSTKTRTKPRNQEYTRLKQTNKQMESNRRIMKGIPKKMRSPRMAAVQWARMDQDGRSLQGECLEKNPKNM